MTRPKADTTTTDDWGFRGFAKPEQNWHRIPNDWVNVCAKLAKRRSLSTVIVLQYVLRHTWGFSEYEEPKRITLDEFVGGRKYADGSRMDLGTGLSERTVQDALKEALSLGLLVMDVDDADRGRVRRSFRLRMLGEPLSEGDADSAVG